MILVAFHEVVDEICIEESLSDACYKRCVIKSLPIIDPYINQIITNEEDKIFCKTLRTVHNER